MPSLIERLNDALAGRYSVESEIGRGGMATVFLAEDIRHHRKVAIKVLHPELASAVGTERFLNEIEIVAGLEHPHILPLIDSGEAGGLLYYVMPYVDGESLRDRIERERQLPIDDAIRIAAEVADALDYAHEQGVVHRDIKPGNILLRQGHAAIADFGVAKAVGQAGERSSTATGMAVGTPAYMSPEQGSGEQAPDGRTDIYALGCVLYEMLAGDPPFTGATPQAVLKRHSVDPVPALRTVRDTAPESVEYAIEKALAKVPADRFSTTREFVQALEAPRPRPPKRKRWTVGIVAAAAAIVGAIAIGPVRDFLSREGAETVTVVLGTPIIEDLDPALGSVILTYLESALLSSARVNATVPRDVGQALEAMGREPDTELDEATALEVAQRTGSAGAVLPTLQQVGGGMLLAARVVAPDGHRIAIVTRPVADEDALTRVLDSLTIDLRRELGESRRALRASPSLLHLVTPSLEAARLFAEARSIYASEPARATSLLEQAIEIDPDFAWAYDYLSTIRQNAGGEYLSFLEREIELADRLPPQQRRLAEISGLQLSRGDYQAAIELTRESIRSPSPGVRDDPDFPLSYYTYLVLSYMEIGDPEQAEAAYAEWVARVEAGEVDEWESVSRVINSAIIAGQLRDLAGADRYLAQWKEVVPEVWDWLGEVWAMTAGGQWRRAAEAAGKVLIADVEPAERMQASLLLGSLEAVRGRPRSSGASFSMAISTAHERVDPFHSLSARIHAADAQFFALADPQRASAHLLDFLGQRPGPGLARRYRARAQALALAICAHLDVLPVEGPASGLDCGADVATDSLLDPIETLEALGWEAAAERRYRDAVRIGSEPRLLKAGGAGLRALAPAAFAYEKLGIPDSAAAIYRKVVRAPFGFVSHAPSAMVLRSYALQRLAGLGGTVGDSAAAVLREDWADAEFEFLARMSDR